MKNISVKAIDMFGKKLVDVHRIDLWGYHYQPKGISTFVVHKFNDSLGFASKYHQGDSWFVTADQIEISIKETDE